MFPGKKTQNKTMIMSLLVAAVLWYLMFIIKPMNFWLEMSLSISVLILLALLGGANLSSLKGMKGRHVIIGVFSSLGLYFIFYLGNFLSRLIFPFSKTQILSVYSNRNQSSLIVIALLLLFIIGSGEEIYWRGFIQQKLEEKFGKTRGLLFGALIYSLVHITTGNFMLILAALVCGLNWGWLYQREKSLIPILLSHALWDVMIFVLWPIK